MRVIAGLARGRPLLAPPGRSTRPTSDRLKQALFNILGDAVPDASVLDLYAGSGALGIEALSRGARAATFVERDPRAARVLQQNLERCGLAGSARIVVADTAAACRRFAAAAATAASSPSAVSRASAASAACSASAGSAASAGSTACAGSTATEGSGASCAAAASAASASGASAASSASAGSAAPAAPAVPAVPAPPERFSLVLADPPYATGAAQATLALLAGDGAAALAPGALIAIEHAPGEEMPDAAGNLRLMRRRGQGRGCVSVYGLTALRAEACDG